MRFTRRAALGGVATLPFAGSAKAEDFVPVVTVQSRVLDVKGKPAKVFGITGSDGKPGLKMVLGQKFRFNLKNDLGEETAIHWHGLTPPVALDGVPMLSGTSLRPGEQRLYDFANDRAGTHWMHSHLGLQEQRLLAAPLIVAETAQPLFDEDEHVVMLHDFTFRDPQEILSELQKGGGGHAMHMAGMMMPDIAYDAMLANDRTLDDPEIVTLEKGSQLRLRIINGASASNMWIDLGELEGSLIAVDGNTIKPHRGKRFPLAIAQRADIRLLLPHQTGAWPILFQVEGDTLRSGIILKTGEGKIAKISDQGEAGPQLDLALESQIRSAAVLPVNPVNRVEVVNLTGGTERYAWGFNGNPMMHDVLFSVREGERVELTMMNSTAMAHPMHLHGHYFKVTAIGSQRVDGAVRDTLLVPPDARVSIQFDADNPGSWAFHCHHLYHMNSGMMAAMAYVSPA